MGGRTPEALVHDNKPIHEDRILRQTVDPDTTMIPARPGRPEDKAVIEGEFGKFEQAVGHIKLDDSSPESLVKSAAEEVLRAYTAGINPCGPVFDACRSFVGRARILERIAHFWKT